MSIKTINGKLLKKMIISAVNNLNESRNLVDSLNVFPVPDGDTGTNMSLTALSAAKEVLKNNDDASCAQVAKSAADGSLRGARGNSGVILSQLFRGFSKAIEGKKIIDAADIAEGLKKASDTAYRAVMKPKEGTVLTVAKAASNKAFETVGDTDDIERLIKEIICHTSDVLKKTTDMLPVLKEANVVDAGGKGLVLLYEGFYKGIYEDTDLIINETSKNEEAAFEKPSHLDTKEIKYSYCTEFFINSDKILDSDVTELKKYFESIGDSTIVVNDDKMVKVHTHTNNPGNVLESSLKIGHLSNIKIDNMKLQHTHINHFVKENENNELSVNLNNNIAAESVVGNALQSATELYKIENKIGFIAVSAGDGINSILKELNVDCVLEGGQTMNPSAQDFVNVINMINKEDIIILPNNKNIILAAKQSIELIKNKNIKVIETVSIPQGISAMLSCGSHMSFDKTVEVMEESINTIKSAQVTTAVREVTLNGKSIKTGDFIGIVEEHIKVVSSELIDAAKQTAAIIAENSDFVTIYYGENSDLESANEIKNFIEENYSDAEVEVQYGGQPVYHFIISGE